MSFSSFRAGPLRTAPKYRYCIVTPGSVTFERCGRRSPTTDTDSCSRSSCDKAAVRRSPTPSRLTDRRFWSRCCSASNIYRSQSRSWRTTWTRWGCRPCFRAWRCSSFKAARRTCWRGRRWTVDFGFAGYFAHIAKVNQLLVLSQQLEEDVRHLGSHKYVAHQLSVIYQVVSSFRGVDVFSETKKDIEANFKRMKESLVPDEGSRQQAQLPAAYVRWILDVTRKLTSAALSLPDELTDDLEQAVTFVSQFVSAAPPAGRHP
ncbi:uncharacterized protein si:ch211-218d20.15 isoform X2 [Syngnathoides biaculeatus]|uniref:uncharacterized protein si:ch211-218d20.15 isoform X2 n=1 Tax=Syngnathoides biaculeatus TaxID=300417 RepID=UPI002ADE75D6|nr:uncharacterized protein si:ch211-218d20.15 isoform X2 [Syngnathoides biaculeatus]